MYCTFFAIDHRHRFNIYHYILGFNNKAQLTFMRYIYHHQFNPFTNFYFLMQFGNPLPITDNLKYSNVALHTLDFLKFLQEHKTYYRLDLTLDHIKLCSKAFKDEFLNKSHSFTINSLCKQLTTYFNMQFNIYSCNIESALGNLTNINLQTYIPHTWFNNKLHFSVINLYARRPTSTMNTIINEFIDYLTKCANCHKKFHYSTYLKFTKRLECCYTTAEKVTYTKVSIYTDKPINEEVKDIVPVTDNDKT